MFKGDNSKKPSSNKIEKEFKDLRKNLLDLTLRNQLLNFKDRAQTLTISNQSPKNMYSYLVLQNKSMKFISNQEKNAEEESSRFGFKKPSFNNFIHDDTKLEINLTEKGLEKKLFYINNQSKTMIDEQGYNILYIAIGFLKWIDKSKPTKTNLAPLILIPVSMQRKQIGNSFSISWTGEDIQTNISLKTKLAEEGIIIPEFEAGSFIEAPEQYMGKISEAVHQMKKWEVTDKVALGFFSFTKFIMYNDLNPQSWEENVDLTNHPLIQAIFDPSVNDTNEFKEDEIDEKISYKDMYQVLDADSSQIAVIEDVKAGRNLVVEGPPGTGKSQTIVNLIAELLAEDKTVLFVSEKMAALEVVKSRLTAVGLGKFILELHSHKTRRKKFLKELQKSTNVRNLNELNIDRTIRKLETLKVQLDEYSQLIHKPLYAVQLSAFDLYGKKEYAEEYFSSQSKILPLVRFDHAEDLTMKDLDDMILLLENLAELNGTINQQNPWSYCSPNSLLPSDLREIEMLITDSSRALDDFKIDAQLVEEKFGIKQPINLKKYNETLKALEFLDADFPIIDKKILYSPAWDNPKGAVKLINDLEYYQNMENSLMMKFDQDILLEDINILIKEFEESSNKRFSLFSKSNKKEITKYYKGKVPKDSEVLNDLKQVQEFQKLAMLMESEKETGYAYFSNGWNLSQSPKELKKIYKWMFEVKRLLKLEIFTEKIYDYITNDFEVEPIKILLKDFISEGENFKKELNKLQSKLKPNTHQIFKMNAEDVPFDDWVKQFNKWNGHFSSLHLWSQYLQAKEDCKDNIASIFINTIEKRQIKIDEVKPLVLGNFADSLLNRLFIDNPELNAFVGELHENRIKEFKDLDKKILKLNQKRIFNKLNQKIPKIYGQADNEEARILAGEFTRKSGHLPVRKLIEKAGGVIKQIKPIFMMSPLSIAQYLDPTNPKLQFDVVIFDEASQVKPEDALGAFMRGKTAVVMGDTQQLPPTSFFDQIIEGESHEEVAGALDMESILHLCKMSFPVKMLKWHYRSRHESLIAVSNREFYDNNLLVYPSPSHDNPELGLKFKYCPDTIYERGEGSHNKGEARSVVEAIFEHFEKYGDSKSLGVGTFSVAQRNAILEELERERKLHPELEPLFSENKEDKFFVKNLETIQGDERDVILISVGYGFDQNRKMSLNFGPLNQDGGERRLNVLVTRAKEKCVVFSNFRSHDIHLTANPPFGVRALKEFLEYAENLTIGNIPTFNDVIEPFEEAIYTFLINQGYAVHKHIGCAGFRVDLAIVDDENPGRYLLGITTDGKMYSSSKVARDRDRLREQVLKGLDWKLYHLWSTDWYRNREVSKEKLIKAIEHSKKETIKEDARREKEEREFKEKMEAEKQKRLEAIKKAEEEEQRKKEEKLKEQENNQTEDNESDIDSPIEVVIENDNLNKDLKDNDNIKEDDEYTRSEPTEINHNGEKGSKSNRKISDKSNNNSELEHEDNELEDVISVDDEMINQLKSEIDSELKEDIKNNENDKSSKNTKESLKQDKNIEEKSSSTNKIKNIGSYIESKISSLKSNHDEDENKTLSGSIESDSKNNDYKTEDQNKKSDNKLKSKKHLESLKNKSKKSDKTSKSQETQDSDNNSSHIKSSDDFRIIASDDEYEYVEVPIDRELKEGEELVEYVTNNKNINPEVEADEKIVSDMDQKENIKQILGHNIENNLNKDSNNDNINLNYNMDDFDITEEDFDKIINTLIDTDSDEDNPLNTYMKIHESNPAVNDNYDLNILNDNKLSDKNQSYIQNKIENIKDFDNKNITDTYSNIKTTNNNEIKNITNSNETDFNDETISSRKNTSLKSSNTYENNSNEAIMNKISDVKKELEYINHSLQEIEKSSPEEVAQVFDKISQDINEMEKSFEQTHNIHKNNDNHKEEKTNQYNDTSINSNLNENQVKDSLIEYNIPDNPFDEYISDSDINNNIDIYNTDDTFLDSEDLEKIKNSKFTENEIEEIENFIEDLNLEDKNLDKENNPLKSDNNISSPNNKNITDYISPYIEANDFDFKTQEEIYNNPISYLAEEITKIVKIEGPVNKKIVTKRIKDHIQIKRMSSKLKKTIEEAIVYGKNNGLIRENDEFLYPNDINFEIIIRKREKPMIDNISNDEIAANIKLVLTFNEILSIDNIIKEVAHNFGFKSTTQKTSSKIKTVIDIMLKESILEVYKGNIKLKS